MIRIIETASPHYEEDIVKVSYENNITEAKVILFEELDKVQGNRQAELATAIANKTGDQALIPYLKKVILEAKEPHTRYEAEKAFIGLTEDASYLKK